MGARNSLYDGTHRTRVRKKLYVTPSAGRRSRERSTWKLRRAVRAAIARFQPVRSPRHKLLRYCQFHHQICRRHDCPRSARCLGRRPGFLDAGAVPGNTPCQVLVGPPTFKFVGRAFELGCKPLSWSERYVACWHLGDVPERRNDVRSWGLFGRDMLAASLSAFDPSPT